MVSVTKKQPAPVNNEAPDVGLLVMKDMALRRGYGVEKHGTPLQPNNGRDALTALYHELLDAVANTRQMLYERDGR
jgi:hypothetical protein